MKLRSTVGVLVVLVGFGCGSTPPPKELVDARETYEKVKAGQASQLKPDQVHEAKVALDTAEQAFNDDPSADRTRDLAYIAQRKAEYAAAQAGIAAAAATKEQSSKELISGLKAAQGAAQGELSKTKEQLALTGQALETEKKAREAAEKRAKDAMDKLALSAALAVKEESRGTVITLPGSVLFPSAKWELLPGATEKLNAVADALKNQGDVSITVEGHTDSQGNESSNMELSQKRAQSVRDYLVSRGVASSSIGATGIGQSRPVADNTTAAGRQNNRRVEIVVKPIEKR
jgi:outer membrane protein OmpA-like peptidoglycan-associated protein